MKIIRNNKLIKKGYNGFAFWPFIFLREDLMNEDRIIRHEKIHIRQQLEMLVIPFYVVYFLSYFVNFFRYGRMRKAYYNIPFEKEAYANENDLGYLKWRRTWAWFRYW